MIWKKQNKTKKKQKTKYNYHQRPQAWYFVCPILKSQKLNNFHLLLKKNPWTVHNDQLKGCDHSTQVAWQEKDLSQQGYIKRPTIKSEPSKNTTFFLNRGTWSDQIKRKIHGLILPTNGKGIVRMFHRGSQAKNLCHERSSLCSRRDLQPPNENSCFSHFCKLDSESSY